MAWNHRCAGSNRGRRGSIVLVGLEVSESEPALSTKTPVYSAARQHDAGHLPTELLFQRRAPGHELEAEAIVDHREAPRAQDHPLPVDPSHVLTFRGWPIDEPGWRGDLPDGVVQFSTSQGVEQIAREEETLSLLAGEAFTGEVFSATPASIRLFTSQTTSHPPLRHEPTS
jgi:hypothetical protein